MSNVMYTAKLVVKIEKMERKLQELWEELGQIDEAEADALRDKLRDLEWNAISKK